MAIGTISGIMSPCQWEPAPLVNLRNVVHDPGGRRMATAAVGTDGLVMHVGMAIHACSLGIGKYECRVTAFAVGRQVLADQRQGGFAVIERIDGLIQLPAVLAVAYTATDLEILPVRGIRKQVN
jgi:hypothetical protein